MNNRDNMRSKGTQHECTEFETKRIMAFEKEFVQLCEKYGVQWLFAWAGPATEKFTDTGKKLALGIVRVHIDWPMNSEMNALLQAYSGLQDEVIKMIKDFMQQNPWSDIAWKTIEDLFKKQ